MWGIKMKAILNPFVFSQVNLDSASLTMLTSAVHKISEAGTYDGTILRGPDIVGRFRLAVSDSGPENCSVESRNQVNIDLKSLDLPVAYHIESQLKNCFQVRTGGYVVFHLSSGAGGYAVELRKTGTEKGATKIFDSRKLNENDHFIATPLRPGTYCVTNVGTKAKAELVVAYPEIGKIPKQPQATKVECNQTAIIPSEIKINPTEPLLFSFKVASRIKIELVKPEDRPLIANQMKNVKQSIKQSSVPGSTQKPIRELHINV
jgi:hypothetical protein